MTELEHAEFNRLKEIFTAIKFNHNIEGKVKGSYNVDEELEKYRTRITQMTLPNRFGMYKTQTKNVKEKTEVELEEPGQVDSTQHGNQDPNHKRRGIFD